MGPKKAKGKGKGKKGKKTPPPPPPEPEEQIEWSDDADEKEMDYLLDINEDFFDTANRIVQLLMEKNRIFEASRIKKYVNIINRLHSKYSDEVREIEELRPKIKTAEDKLRYSLELVAHSQEAMDILKENLAEAWRETDASLLREQDVQEKLQEVLIKCQGFESKEEQNRDDNAEFGALGKYKNIILRERDRLNGEVLDLEKRLHMQRYYSESLEYIVKNNEDTINKLNIRVRVMLNDKANTDIKLRNLRNNLEDQKETTTKTESKLDSANRELNDVQLKLSRKIADIDHLKVTIEKLRNDNSIISKLLSRTEDDLKDLRKDQKYNEEIIRNLRLDDQSKANAISQLSGKYKKSVQDYSLLSSKLYKMNKANHNLNEEIARLKNQVNALEKNIATAAHKYEELRLVKENTLRERDILRSDIIKTNNVMADLRHQIMVQSNTMDTLRLDINKLNVKLDEAKINVMKAERERDEMSQEMESLQERIEYFQEQVQLKSNQVTDLSEKLQQKNFALINVKKQLEAVHSEKMILQRNLETCTQERDDFRILQAKNSHQISQLTNEIVQNQNKINSLNMRIERLNNEKKDLQTDLKNTENLLANVRQDLKEMKYKNEQHLKTIADDEMKFMKIKQSLEETRKEKNLVGLQMVRRNDEIILLREKLDVLQLALDQGQSQYNQRVEDIRLLKTEITKLQTERECHKRALKSTADMREEIIRIQRLLNQERVKVRALMEDTKTPTAVHRWRILRGEDPDKYSLMQKVQVLQKRNLKQHVEKGNLEKELQETKNMFDALKKSVETLPASDVQKKLLRCQQILDKRTIELKSLKGEVYVFDIELKARQCIIEQLKAQILVLTEKCMASGDYKKIKDEKQNEQEQIPTANYADAIFDSSEEFRYCTYIERNRLRAEMEAETNQTNDVETTVAQNETN